jgi:hypothetical protein
VYVSNFGDLYAFIWINRFDLWPSAQASYGGGVRFSEGYVGTCLAVTHTAGALVGFVVVDDAGV